ncbi:Type-1 restriction enzyme MjaXIP specificity protein [uncultured archaeon]|nr:Type-1 restriction enzyme MjaXIP specificity protein [uncultured archaeon]
MKKSIKFKKTEIGMIPEDWELVAIKDIGIVITGKTPPTKIKEYFGTEYPFIKIPDMDKSVYIENTETSLSKRGMEYMGKLKLPKDSVMVSCLATIGKVGITKRESFTNQQINSLIGNKNKILPLWAYYYFKANTFYLGSLGGGGSVYNNISKSKFENMLILLPIIDEQKKIVQILFNLDSKIELNQQMNKTLEAIGQAIFKHWFVDFEFPNEQGKPYKSSGGELVDSELGKMPKGWRVGKLGDFITIKNGFAFKGSDFTNKGIPVIKIKNVKAGQILLDNLSYVSQAVYEKYKMHIIELGDLLITMSGNRIDGSPDTWVGKVALFTRAGDYLLNQRVSIIDIKQGILQLKYYVSQLLSGEDYQYYFITHATSSGGQANISPDLIKKVQIVIPDIDLLKNYTGVMDKIFNKICMGQIENEALSQIRNSLLPRLMSGQIRIPIEI